MNKHLLRNIELGITFCLSAFYLGVNLPRPIPSILALLSFLIIPLLIIRQWRSFIYVATRDIILLLIVGTAVISVLWSTNPGETLASSRAILSSTAFGIYLVTRYSPKEQLSLFACLFGIYTVLNLLAAVLFPSYGLPFRIQDGGIVLQGIAGHKNQLAAAMAMTTTLFLDISFYSRKYRWQASIAASVAFMVLIFSKGKGSLAVFIGMLCLLPLYKIAKVDYRLKTFFGICAFLISTVIITITSINLELIVVDFLEKDMNLSGRIPLWDYLIQRGMEKPLLGYGYGPAFWNNPTERLGVELNTWIKAVESVGNSHNAYVELFLQLGFLGVFLVILSFVMVLIRVIMLLSFTKQIEYFWMLQLLLFMAISSYSEVFTGLLVSYRSLYWVLYVSICCSTAIHLKRILKTGNKLENLRYENITYQH